MIYLRIIYFRCCSRTFFAPVTVKKMFKIESLEPIYWNIKIHNMTRKTLTRLRDVGFQDEQFYAGPIYNLRILTEQNPLTSPRYHIVHTRKP